MCVYQLRFRCFFYRLLNYFFRFYDRFLPLGLCLSKSGQLFLLVLCSLFLAFPCNQLLFEISRSSLFLVNATLQHVMHDLVSLLHRLLVLNFAYFLPLLFHFGELV